MMKKHPKIAFCGQNLPSRQKNDVRCQQAAMGFEPMNNGFAT
jgi:hypothetical protein